MGEIRANTNKLSSYSSTLKKGADNFSNVKKISTPSTSSSNSKASSIISNIGNKINNKVSSISDSYNSTSKTLSNYADSVKSCENALSGKSNSISNTSVNQKVSNLPDLSSSKNISFGSTPTNITSSTKSKSTGSASSTRTVSGSNVSSAKTVGTTYNQNNSVSKNNDAAMSDLYNKATNTNSSIEDQMKYAMEYVNKYGSAIPTGYNSVSASNTQTSSINNKQVSNSSNNLTASEYEMLELYRKASDTTSPIEDQIKYATEYVNKYGSAIPKNYDSASYKSITDVQDNYDKLNNTINSELESISGIISEIDTPTEVISPVDYAKNVIKNGASSNDVNAVIDEVNGQIKSLRDEIKSGKLSADEISLKRNQMNQLGEITKYLGQNYGTVYAADQEIKKWTSDYATKMMNSSNNEQRMSNSIERLEKELNSGTLSEYDSNIANRKLNALNNALIASNDNVFDGDTKKNIATSAEQNGNNLISKGIDSNTLNLTIADVKSSKENSLSKILNGDFVSNEAFANEVANIKYCDSLLESLEGNLKQVTKNDKEYNSWEKSFLDNYESKLNGEISTKAITEYQNELSKEASDLKKSIKSGKLSAADENLVRRKLNLINQATQNLGKSYGQVYTFEQNQKDYEIQLERYNKAQEEANNQVIQEYADYQNNLAEIQKSQDHIESLKKTQSTVKSSTAYSEIQKEIDKEEKRIGNLTEKVNDYAYNNSPEYKQYCDSLNELSDLDKEIANLENSYYSSFTSMSDKMYLDSQIREKKEYREELKSKLCVDDSYDISSINYNIASLEADKEEKENELRNLQKELLYAPNASKPSIEKKINSLTTEINGLNARSDMLQTSKNQIWISSIINTNRSEVNRLTKENENLMSKISDGPLSFEEIENINNQIQNNKNTITAYKSGNDALLELRNMNSADVLGNINELINKNTLNVNLTSSDKNIQNKYMENQYLQTIGSTYATQMGLSTGDLEKIQNGYNISNEEFIKRITPVEQKTPEQIQAEWQETYNKLEEENLANMNWFEKASYNIGKGATNFFTGVGDTVKDIWNESYQAGSDLYNRQYDLAKQYVNGDINKTELLTGFSSAGLATATQGALSVVTGLGKGAEAVLDTAATLVIGLASIGTSVADAINGDFGKPNSMTAKIYDHLDKFVSKDYMGDARDMVYDTDFGKWLNDNSIYKNGGFVTGTLEGVGESVFVIASGQVVAEAAGLANTGKLAQSLKLTGAAPTVAQSTVAVAATKGFGRGMETALNDGATMAQATTYGALSATWESAQWAVGMKINGVTNAALSSSTSALSNVSTYFKSILADSVDAGIEGFVQPALKMTYSDKSYGELFEENGGWKTVAQQATIGGVMSAVGTANDFISSTGKITGADKIDVGSAIKTKFNDISTNIKNVTDNVKTKFNDISVSAKNVVDNLTSKITTKGLKVETNSVNATIKNSTGAKIGPESLVSFITKYIEKPIMLDVGVNGHTIADIGMYNKIMDEGLLHFTSLDSANKIIESGTVRPTKDLPLFYDNNKAYFFAGNPTFDQISINLGGKHTPTIMTAVKIKPTDIQLNGLKFRYLDDMAISSKGGFKFDSNQAEIVYYGITKNAEGKLEYKPISKDMASNYDSYLKEQGFEIKQIKKNGQSMSVVDGINLNQSGLAALTEIGKNSIFRAKLAVDEISNNVISKVGDFVNLSVSKVKNIADSFTNKITTSELNSQSVAKNIDSTSVHLDTNIKNTLKAAGGIALSSASLASLLTNGDAALSLSLMAAGIRIVDNSLLGGIKGSNFGIRKHIVSEVDAKITTKPYAEGIVSDKKIATQRIGQQITDPTIFISGRLDTNQNRVFGFPLLNLMEQLKIFDTNGDKIKYSCESHPLTLKFLRDLAKDGYIENLKYTKTKQSSQIMEKLLMGAPITKIENGKRVLRDPAQLYEIQFELSSNKIFDAEAAEKQAIKLGYDSKLYNEKNITIDGKEIVLYTPNMPAMITNATKAKIQAAALKDSVIVNKDFVNDGFMLSNKVSNVENFKDDVNFFTSKLSDAENLINLRNDLKSQADYLNSLTPEELIKYQESKFKPENKPILDGIRECFENDSDALAIDNFINAMNYLLENGSEDGKLLAQSIVGLKQANPDFKFVVSSDTSAFVYDNFDGTKKINFNINQIDNGDISTTVHELGHALHRLVDDNSMPNNFWTDIKDSAISEMSKHTDEIKQLFVEHQQEQLTVFGKIKEEYSQNHIYETYENHYKEIYTENLKLKIIDDMTKHPAFALNEQQLVELNQLIEQNLVYKTIFDNNNLPKNYATLASLKIFADQATEKALVDSLASVRAEYMRNELFEILDRNFSAHDNQFSAFSEMLSGITGGQTSFSEMFGLDGINVTGHRDIYYQANPKAGYSEFVTEYSRLKFTGQTEMIDKIRYFCGDEFVNTLDNEYNKIIVGLKNLSSGS